MSNDGLDEKEKKMKMVILKCNNNILVLKISESLPQWKKFK